MKTHWTDEFERLLKAKLAELDQSRTNRDQIAIESTAEEEERIQLAGQRELAILALDRDATLRREILAAMERIEDGSFGTCEECESSIAMIRLKAIPWARHCVSCQERLDREPSMSAERWSMLIAA